MAHRCSYCGKAGHKRPTCPTLREAKRATTGEVLTPSPTVSDPPSKPKVRKATPKKSTQWAVAESVLPYCTRALLYGPPGTGKTTVGNKSVVPGTEVYNVTLTEEMPAAELRGHYVPRGGEFVWQDGPAMMAYRNGGRVVLNEIDRGSADALIFCYALLDDPGISRITLPTGESVYPHEGFSVIATMNGEPDDLPEALQDRFDVRILIDKPHPDAMLTLPEDLRTHAHNSVSGAGESRVSFRSWKAYGRLRELVGEDVAAKAVFGNRATAILDTLKLSRVGLHTEEASATPSVTVADTRPDGAAGFRPGDTVRVIHDSGMHFGKEYVVAERLADHFANTGKILVGERGEWHFLPAHLELVFPASASVEEDYPDDYPDDYYDEGDYDEPEDSDYV